MRRERISCFHQSLQKTRASHRHQSMQRTRPSCSHQNLQRTRASHRHQSMQRARPSCSHQNLLKIRHQGKLCVVVAPRIGRIILLQMKLSSQVLSKNQENFVVGALCPYLRQIPGFSIACRKAQSHASFVNALGT